jgi:HEAT repeat protein
VSAISGRPLSDRTGRRRLVAEAGHRGDDVTARAHLGDDDAGVRATALRALRRCGALLPADVVGAAADPHPAVRRTAAELVAHWPADDPAVSLLPLLDDPDPSVVEAAAWAAGERLPPGPGVVGRLVALAADHDDALVREAAVAALGSTGDEAARAAILAALDDRATVRRRAVIALAPFEGPDVEAALDRARHDRDAQVRAAADDLLQT